MIVMESMKPDLDRTVFIDFETQVLPGYSLGTLSTDKYIDDGRFLILGVSIAAGPTSPIKVCLANIDEHSSLDAARSELLSYCAQGYTMVAHNAVFDAMILTRRWDISFSHYFDTMAYSRFLGIGGSLSNTAEFFGHRKAAAPEFSVESLRFEQSRRELARYCATDTALARKVFLNAFDDPTLSDLEYFLIDQTVKINLRGLRIDRDRVNALMLQFREIRDQTQAEITGLYTGGLPNLNSVPKMKVFIKAEFGVNLDTLDRRDPTLGLHRQNNAQLGRFFALRDRWRTATRYLKFLEQLKSRERIWSPIRYYGAHTGRFASGGRDSGQFNVQNLPVRHESVPELSTLRSIIVPEPGLNFVVGDLSTIEARITAFIAGEEELLNMFRRGVDIYIWFASQAFPSVIVEKDGRNSHLRRLAKQAILGLGFGMGLERFQKKIKETSPELDPQIGKVAFEAYRSRFPRVKLVKGALYASFHQAFDSGLGSQIAGCWINRSLLPEHRGDTTLQVLLPTGRPLYYRSVRKTVEMAPWGGLTTMFWYTDAFEVNSNGGNKRQRGVAAARNRKFSDGRFRTQLLPQTLIENVVQGVARDLLMAQVRDLELKDNLRVVFHVHDEVIVESDACHCDPPHFSAKDIETAHRPDCPWIRARRCVRDRLSSVPADLEGLEGLPVACEISDTIREAYGK